MNPNSYPVRPHPVGGPPPQFRPPQMGGPPPPNFPHGFPPSGMQGGPPMMQGPPQQFRPPPMMQGGFRPMYPPPMGAPPHMMPIKKVKPVRKPKAEPPTEPNETLYVRNLHEKKNAKGEFIFYFH